MRLLSTILACSLFFSISSLASNVETKRDTNAIEKEFKEEALHGISMEKPKPIENMDELLVEKQDITVRGYYTRSL